MPRSSRDPSDPSDLGPSLRAMRTHLNLSLRDVEQASGLSNGYLSQLERNAVSHPSPTVLRKVAEGYGVDFRVLLQWAGYLKDEEFELSPNQAAALSTIGEPTTEELDAIKSIIGVLRAKGMAGFFESDAPIDTALDYETRRHITGYCRALLLEADAIGKRPTPLEDLAGAADLVRSGELTLTEADKIPLHKRFGRRQVDLAWNRLSGTLDFRNKAIWIKPGLPPKRERFVLGHEIGHGILPAHQDFFAYIDDRHSLSPAARMPFEREANVAAAALLFQCGQLIEEADSSPLTLERICEYADRFGASIVSTAREVAEKSRRDVGVAIAFTRGGPLGPPHFYASESFRERYRWGPGRGPAQTLRAELNRATSLSHTFELPTLDARDRETTLRVDSVHTGWAAILLLVRESKVRRTARRLIS